jgi:hypothetical protein
MAILRPNLSAKNGMTKTSMAAPAKNTPCSSSVYQGTPGTGWVRTYIHRGDDSGRIWSRRQVKIGDEGRLSFGSSALFTRHRGYHTESRPNYRCCISFS